MTDLNNKVDGEKQVNIPDDDRDRVPGASNIDFNNDKRNIQNNEKKGEDSEVDVFHNSSHLPVEILLVASFHRRSCRIIAL